MRIAIFTETFLPKIDGIVNTFCYLLDYLAAQGHESLLFAPEGSLGHYAATPVIRYPGVTFPWYPELKLAWPTWSIVVYIGLALGKEVHSYFDVNLLRRLAPSQNGGLSGRNIATVCRSLIEAQPLAEPLAKPATQLQGGYVYD